jgi:hypothetical protein
MSDDTRHLHVVACLPLSAYPLGHPDVPAQLATCFKCDTRVWLPCQLQGVLERDTGARIVCVPCCGKLATDDMCARVEYRDMHGNPIE